MPRSRVLRWIASSYLCIGVLYSGLWVYATQASLLWCAFLVVGWLPWQIAPNATGATIMAVGLGPYLFAPR